MDRLHLRGPVEAGVPLTASQHDENMLRLYGFGDLAALLADEDRAYDFYAAGETITTLAEGFRYQVAASGATDHHLETDAGLKLYVLPGAGGIYNLLAFNPAADDVTDDWAVFDLAARVAAGAVLRVPKGTYYLAQTWQISDRVTIIGEAGARLRFPAGTTGIITHQAWTWGHTGICPRATTSSALLADEAGLIQHDGQVYGAAPSFISAALAAQEPGTVTHVWGNYLSNNGRWVHLRAVGEGDGGLPTWDGGGPFAVVSKDPLAPNYPYYMPGTYVFCQTGPTWYTVAPADASDHDAVTRFGVKLYIVGAADYPPYTTASGSLIEGLTIDGTEPTGTEADGIWIRAAATIRNVTVENFSRHGIAVIAGVPSQGGERAPEIWGNANGFVLDNCHLDWNGGAGVWTQYADTNAGSVMGCSSKRNGRYGFYDASFLGNTYIGCRTEGNGLGASAGNSGGRSSVIAHDGKYFRAVFAQASINAGMSSTQTALLVSTTPGTNPAVWEQIGEGEPTEDCPAWRSGQEAGFYFHGGGSSSINNNARTVWLGCSSGPEEAGNTIVSTVALVFGGYMPNMAKGGQVSAREGGHLLADSLGITIPGAQSLGLLPDTGVILNFHNASDTSQNVWSLKWHNGNIRFDCAHLDAKAFQVLMEAYPQLVR